ncbi:MAG: hypothetical protein IJ985_01755, partial [Akkermansia sp.]|nr:hypothetical protein [Akkermansia sp.]
MSMLSGDDILAADEVLCVSDPAGSAACCGFAGFGKQAAAYYPIRGGCVDGATEHFCCAIHLWVQKARILSLGTL